MIRLIPLFLFFVVNNGVAQTSDILLLKKSNKTVGHFFAGSAISFFTQDDHRVEGTIDSIRRDSIFITHQTTTMVPNMYGTYSPYLGPAYQMQFAVSDIAAFPMPRPKLALIRSGILFTLGGSAYLVLNTVNTLREKDPLFGKDNLPRVIGGASAIALGLILKYTQRTRAVLGKKYQLVLIPAS